MIKAIANIGFYKNTSPSSKNVEYTSSPVYSSCKINNNLVQDVFQPSKSYPSFCGLAKSIIPKKEIFSLCDSVIASLDSNSPQIDPNSLLTYFQNQLGKILPQKQAEAQKAEDQIYRVFRHEMNNLAEVISGKLFIMDMHLSKGRTTEAENLRKEVIAAVDSLKENIKDWTQLFNDSSLSNILGLLNKVNMSTKVTWKGVEKLDGKKVSKDKYFDLYSLFSQPILNAIKYGEGMPVRVAIEEGKTASGAKQLFASVTNPDTTPIPDAEIDKILQGKGHRADAIKDKIKGTGFGFQEMIRILKENGHESDIPDLIEKGREKGVCVRFPLIGIQD